MKRTRKEAGNGTLQAGIYDRFRIVYSSIIYNDAGCRLPVAGCRLPVAGCRRNDCSLIFGFMDASAQGGRWKTSSTIWMGY